MNAKEKTKSNNDKTDSDSLVLKIETQKSDTYAFSGMKDQREVGSSSNKYNKGKMNSFDQRFVSSLIVILLTCVYYCTINRMTYNIMETKAFHSFGLILVLLFDKALSIQKYSKISIVEEEFDNLNDGLLSSNSKGPQLPRSKQDIVLVMILFGVVAFVCESLTYYFLSTHKEYNIGLLYCLLSYEYVIYRLICYTSYGIGFQMINLIGFFAVYVLSTGLSLIQFSIGSLILALIISCLRVLKVTLLNSLKFQYEYTVLLISMLTDFVLGVIVYLYYSYHHGFYIPHLSHFILMLLAAASYFYSIKASFYITVYDISTMSLIYPCIGIIDLIIDNKGLDIAELLIMMVVTLFVYLSFKGEQIVLLQLKK